MRNSADTAADRPARPPRARRPRKENGPSLALSTIFAGLMTAIVVPLVGFVTAFSVGSQGGIDFFTHVLKWAFLLVGAFMVYGMAVGLYHTFLAVTGLDRPSGSKES